MTHYRIVGTELGPIGLLASDHGLKRVLLPTETEALLRDAILRSEPDAVEAPEMMEALAKGLRRFAAGIPVDFRRMRVTFDWRGSRFEQDVWQACYDIAYGETRTYKELANLLGRPGAARAVGVAMGANPTPIVVPCHRVVRTDGSLGGYSGPGGVLFKSSLLEMEGAAVAAV